MSTFVPLEGAGGVAAGPIIGAVVDKAGGPVLIFDVDAGQVRPLRDEELKQIPPPNGQTAEPPKYVLVSKRSGQSGRQAYEHPVLAQLALTARPDAEGYVVAAQEGANVRALSGLERQDTARFLQSVGLGERAP